MGTLLRSAVSKPDIHISEFIFTGYEGKVNSESSFVCELCGKEAAEQSDDEEVEQEYIY